MMKLMIGGVVLFMLAMFVPDAHATTFVCKQMGHEIFTDKKAADCAPYEPTSELGRVTTAEAMLSPSPSSSAAEPSVEARLQETSKPGETSFDKFKNVTAGMTESQVLATVGPPDSEFTFSCAATTPSKVTPQETRCPKMWTYNLRDGWTGDLMIDAGRGRGITSSKDPS
jgi:hypothetical protein